MRIVPKLMLAAALPIAALAAAPVTAALAQSADTTINVNQLLSPWAQSILSALVAVAVALFGWLASVINSKAKLEGNAAILAAEGNMRDALQQALTNAAGRAVMVLGDKLKNASIDVRDPAIRDAVLHVNQSAQDALRTFGIDDKKVADMVINKIGVLTASNPEVFPTARPKS